MIISVGGATGRVAAETHVAALYQQLHAALPHIAALRLQNVRMQNCIDTTHALLSMSNMHPTQTARWCSEGLAVLEPEIAD